MATKDLSERIKEMLKQIEIHRKQSVPITSEDNKPTPATQQPIQNIPLYQDMVKNQKKKQ